MTVKLLSLPYTFTQMVERCYYYTRKEFTKQDGLYILASIGEEFKLQCREEIFHLQLEAGKVNSQLDDKNYHIIFNDTPVAAAKANAMVVNRCADYLFAPLREILRPVWNVYWPESCDSLATVCTWLYKADADNGTKVFAKLEELKSK